MQPTTYTPTQSPTPTYGQSGPTVQALQLQLNQQNQGKPGYTPLVVDGKYGPLTQSATQFGKAPASPFLSSTGARQEYNSMSTQLDNLGATEDPYNQLFEQMKKSTSNTESTAISNAQATKERETNQLNQNRDEYMAGLATAGVMSGANRYLPEYQAGIMEQARQGYLSKYQALDNAERIAIAQAKSAKLDGDIKVMKESLDYIAKIKKEKADAISEANKMEWEKQKHKDEMALRWSTEGRLRKESNTPKPEELKKTFLNGLNVILNSKKDLIPGTDGVPYFTEAGLLTYDGFKDLLQVAEYVGYERGDLIKKLKPYLDIKDNKEKYAKGYGISLSEL